MRLDFAGTANRSQGQSYEVAGVNLTKEFFGHGQLYVAMSRVQSPSGLKIFKPDNADAKTKNYMRNVVYKQILSSAPKQKFEEPQDLFDCSIDFEDWTDFSQLEHSSQPVRIREEIFENEPEENAIPHEQWDKAILEGLDKVDEID